MTSLEHELRGLAPFVDLPAERDFVPAVRERIGERRPRPGKLVLALALVVAALAVAFAVPPARSAILRWLGFQNVRIELVDKLPEAPVRGSLALGPRTTLAEARQRVAYDIVTSARLGSPEEIHVLGDQVAFVYGRRLTVIQVQGRFIEKMVGPGTRIDATPVNGEPGYWISGKPHYFTYMDKDNQFRKAGFHLAGNTLVWQHGELTVRIEGKVTRAQASAIARTFR
jgi:hypothetical protein